VGFESQRLTILANYPLHIIGDAIRYLGVDLNSDPDFGTRQCRQMLQNLFCHLAHVAIGTIRIDLNGTEDPSSLSEIYRGVTIVCRDLDRRMPQELEATVRGTLEDNSSDSERFKGVRDIFCMPQGKHAGVWSLRRRG
jgi:hypothetical protein